MPEQTNPKDSAKALAKKTLIKNFASVGGYLLEVGVSQEVVHMFHASLHTTNQDIAAKYFGYTRVTFTRKLSGIYKYFPQINEGKKISYVGFIKFLKTNIEQIKPEKPYNPSLAQSLQLEMISCKDIQEVSACFIQTLPIVLGKYNRDDKLDILSSLSSDLIKTIKKLKQYE